MIINCPLNMPIEQLHRMIEKLIRCGVIEKDEKGKTNVLKLKKEIKEALDA